MIGTMTFHWATNYGAVLQAYALQRWLILHNYETEIIDYKPLREIFISDLVNLRDKKFKEFRKEKEISRFRKNELILSPRKYDNNKQLLKCNNRYKAIISGSDQIWNMHFTLEAEGGPTLSYFQNFARNNTRRIAYATSFGCTDVSKEYISNVKSELEKFDYISVREMSGKSIVKSIIGRDVELVCDPTFLLSPSDYDQLLSKSSLHNNELGIFTYILHGQDGIDNIKKKVADHFNIEMLENKNVLGVYDWLYRIKHSSFVITNSFHGTALALIFNTPFITIEIPGSGMNDRLNTLLGMMNLKDRMILDTEAQNIDSILSSTIDWSFVNEKLTNLQIIGSNFLLTALEGIE